MKEKFTRPPREKKNSNIKGIKSLKCPRPDSAYNKILRMTHTTLPSSPLFTM